MVKKAIPVAVALLTAVMGLAGCDKKEPSATSTAVSTLPAATSAAPAPSPSPVLPDGRHPVYLTGLDVPGGTVTFDLIQFLTGDEAKKAWVKDHPEYPDGPDNDYYIVNDNPKLRTLRFASTAQIKVMDLTTMKLVSITLDKLPGQLSSWKPTDGSKQLWPAPFWLTVKGGEVVLMEEQFIP